MPYFLPDIIPYCLMHFAPYVKLRVFKRFAPAGGLMITPSDQYSGAGWLNVNKNAHRVDCPSLVIGLGSTSCHIVQHLEGGLRAGAQRTARNWISLYMDTGKVPR